MQTMNTETDGEPEVIETPDPVVETTEVDPQATETPDGSPQNENYKAYVKRIESQNKTLKSQVLDTHIIGIGLDPASGLGVAVREAFNGDEFTIEAVTEFAAEKYQYVAKAPESSKVTEVRTQQQNVDLATNESQPIIPTNVVSDDLVAKENKMNAEDGTQQDAANSLTAKVAAYRQQNPM